MLLSWWQLWCLSLKERRTVAVVAWGPLRADETKRLNSPFRTPGFFCDVFWVSWNIQKSRFPTVSIDCGSHLFDLRMPLHVKLTEDHKELWFMWVIYWYLFSILEIETEKHFKCGNTQACDSINCLRNSTFARPVTSRKRHCRLISWDNEGVEGKRCLNVIMKIVLT